MASQNISRYHGKISKCKCGLADNPTRDAITACKFCFERGFVAECMLCDGKGQVQEKMAGGPGVMSATCNACGGQGSFAVKRPEDWVDPVPEPVPEPAVAAEVTA